MLHVDGRSMVIMESITDRMRLKDKIVANVAKAVKSIQELQLMSGSRTVTLGNQDWQCHRLCEHLDHTLLHGLRHVTPGYWKIVTEFTHKDCVKEIKRMRYVTTDLGRGRAWLFMALNENLLECYLRCFQQNESLTEDFYVRDALVRDQDRFNVLLTLTSGLENISFNLECDVPYLDLCVYPPKSQRMSNVEATVDFDRLSVCSMESIHLPTTGIKPLPQTVFETSNVYGTPYKSSDKDTSSVGSAGSRHSPSVDSGVHSDWNYRQRSITPVDQLGTVVSAGENEESNGAELEVIRLSKKGKPHKHKKKKKRFVSVSSIIDSDVVPDSEPVKDGPTIEIPPLDDFKLMCAIQNNSQTDTHKQTIQSPIHNAKSQSRSPGDGHETPDNKTGNVCRTNTLTPVPDSDKVKNGTHNISDTTDSQTSSNRDSGIFTEMIKAKVADIVDASEDADNIDAACSEQNHVDRRDSCDMHVGNNSPHNSLSYGKIEYDSELLGGLKTAPSFIYDGKNIEENTEISDNVDESQTEETVIEDTSIYGSSYNHKEPSIYGHGHDSDSFSDTDYDAAPFKAPSDSDHSKNSSREASTALCGMGTSTPRSGSALSRSSHTPPVSRGSTPSVTNEQNKLQNKSEESNEKHSDSGFFLPSENEDNIESEYKGSHVQNTQNSLGSKDSRPSSVLSKDSRPSSALSKSSAEFVPASRDRQGSANESMDEDKVSLRTRSTNPTPDSEIAASETALHAKVEELIEHKSLNTYTHLMFEEDEENDMGDEGSAADHRRSESVRSLRAGEVELDNNSMLYLMLDVVEGDDAFVRMFCCRQGHTEGKTKVLFVLLTTCSLYLLQQQQNRRRFSRLAEIPFTDIDFVSLGFNNQILHIACKAKRSKHWLTTGDERVTIALVDCLADSMEKSSSHPARLEVDTGNTIQKISLHKYLAKECRADADEVEVVCYSLVHWEDPACNTASCEWDREGTLYYKSIETATILGTQTWRLGYAVLKDSMLCLYTDKSDAKPTHFLSMSGGQCVGCKRDFNTDKNNAIKVMMEDGSYWTLALESDEEANRWLQGLCQAVSEGLQMNTLRPSCIPCCMILSHQKLLMCHEDLETNFLRTLGSASLQDVTGIMADDINNLYMILVFDSPDDNVSNERWVLYFNSDHECSRFRTSLSACWANHYQVEVPLLPMDDFALQKKCIEMANYLKSSLSFS